MVASRMSLLTYLLGALPLAQYSCALPTEQTPLRVEDVTRPEHNAVQATKQRPLHGRFLHMTGMCTTVNIVSGPRHTNQLQTSTQTDFTKYTPRLLKMLPVTMDRARLASTAPKSAIATAPLR